MHERCAVTVDRVQLSIQDECSFVSLRDVERTMIILMYLYDNMRELSQLIDNQKRKEMTCETVSILCSK